MRVTYCCIRLGDIREPRVVGFCSGQFIKVCLLQRAILLERLSPGLFVKLKLLAQDALRHPQVLEHIIDVHCLLNRGVQLAEDADLGIADAEATGPGHPLIGVAHPASCQAAP